MPAVPALEPSPIGMTPAPAPRAAEVGVAGQARHVPRIGDGAYQRAGTANSRSRFTSMARRIMLRLYSSSPPTTSTTRNVFDTPTVRPGSGRRC